MRNLIWLASYPRSGNTWIRIFLTNLLGKSEEAASINDLHRTPQFSSTVFMEELLGVEVDCLSPGEFDTLLPEAARYYSKSQSTLSVHKTHSALLPDESGEYLIPFECTKLVIYVVRNPLDVCVSWNAFRGSESIDETICFMSDPKSAIGKRKSRFPEQFPQRLSSWSEHVRSWTLSSEAPVLTIRYEDMLLRPFETFKKIGDAVAPDTTDELVKNCIEFSKFNRLSSQEHDEGFRENSASLAPFFRSGEIGSWRSAMTLEQASRIIENHHETMLEFDYLDESGSVVC